MSDRRGDIVSELRAQCLADHETTAGPHGPDDEQLRKLGRDIRWQAADELERLRQMTSTAWHPMDTAPKDAAPVLLFCPRLEGHVCQEIVVGVWRFDANRRTFGYWVSDVGALDTGFAETGPWIEYRELHPERWAPLPPPPSTK